jgi:hypothetical protein
MRRVLIGLVVVLALSRCSGGSYDPWTGNERPECDYECQHSREIAMSDFADWCRYDQGGEITTSYPSGDYVCLRDGKVLGRFGR